MTASGSMPVKVGKYRIDRVIGRGAVGIVYKGHDEQIDRPLAIKTLRREILDDMTSSDEPLRRFAVEARSAGRCLHPNIVTVFDYVEQDGAPYIIMEYVDAGTLENVIRTGTLLPVRQVGEIMAQLLFALGHAHSKGVIHRDVKPANILCPSAASIKVTDFGVAHVDSISLTKSGGLGGVGTPNYMAPERFLGRPADARADLFSAGVILFQLLTGARPFVATDMPELMAKLMNDVPPSIPSFRPELWIGIDALVQRALARNPEDRFQSAEEFIDALNGAVEASAVHSEPPLDLSKLSNPSPKEPQASGGEKDRLNLTMADKLAPETIEALGRSLAWSLGPMAKLLVTRASKESENVDSLLSTLTRAIKTETEVALFRRAAEQTLRQDQGIAGALIGLTVSSAEVRAVTEALIPMMGPMARMIVLRQAETAVGREDFYRRLADYIPEKADKAKLLTMRDKLAANLH